MNLLPLPNETLTSPTNDSPVTNVLYITHRLLYDCILQST